MDVLFLSLNWELAERVAVFSSEPSLAQALPGTQRSSLNPADLCPGALGQQRGITCPSHSQVATGSHESRLTHVGRPSETMVIWGRKIKATEGLVGKGCPVEQPEQKAVFTHTQAASLPGLA